MESLIQQIIDWPEIVQGALGSCLFLISFSLLKYLFSLLVAISGKYNNRFQRELLTNERMRLYYDLNEKDNNAYIHSILFSLYRGIHSIVKACIFLVMGLIFSDIIYIFSIAAYVITLFYLFRALDAVLTRTETRSRKELEERWKYVTEKLSELQGNSDPHKP